jgi:CheY-like chemotaxis protein
MDEDYEVVAVGNGDDALEQLDSITPDFVIADVHMPGANGYDVAKHSKSLRPDVPVLLLVGTFEPFDEELAEKSGCDAYLKKPFDSQELQRLVEELSGKAGHGTGAGEEGPLEATGWQAQSMPSAPPPPPGAANAGQAEEGASELAREESKVEPFSLGPIELDEDEEAAPTRVKPPSEEPPSDALSDEPPVFEDLPRIADLEELDEEEPGLALGGETDAMATEEAAGMEEPPPEPEPGPVEATPPPPAEVAEEPAPPAPRADEEPAQTPPPEQAGDIAAGPLSDQDVDRIARRIVELLGDAAIREVAWEVVPDMAEVVIRTRLRELETQIESVE